MDAAEVTREEKLTLPGEPCQIQPRSSWTPQEQWVWKQVCEGSIADFNTADGYGGWLDPQKPVDWSVRRVLRPAFLETILLHEPWRSGVPRQGVRIKGAWFKEAFDLSYAELTRILWLNYSRFDSAIRLSRLRTPHEISFNGSLVTGALHMDNLHVGSNLFMRDGASFAQVNLRGVQIEGQLSMIKATVTGQLNMDSLRVGSSLLMRNGASFAQVTLRSAQIEGQLDMSKATVTGNLNMNNLRIGSSLFIRNGDFTKRNGDFTKARLINIVFATIGDNLELQGSKDLRSLNLTGTTIGGELRLTGSSSVPKWQPGTQLTLRNG